MISDPRDLKFLPLNFSWVALHPQPIGVIYFIGGAFFGTFPTLFYRYLLTNLFNKGYTIVALPYRFTFRHWSVAISLVKDQETLKAAMIDEAKHRGYDYSIYQEDPTSKKDNYFWLGHSLGCKYIALLELLSDLENQKQTKQELIAKFAKKNNCIPEQEQKSLEDALIGVDLEKISLKNQPSILMAPAIEGLEGAIPVFRNGGFKGLQDFLNKIGIKVEPSQEETFCLINQSQLFNLTRLIYFNQDTRIAAATVKWLLANLGERLAGKKELKGGHLAPLGWIKGDPKISQTVKDFLP
jgi:hypothetical protein